MVSLAVVVALAIFLVDVVVIAGGVEVGFSVFVSPDVAVTIIGVAFVLDIVVVDVQLLLTFFLI